MAALEIQDSANLIGSDSFAFESSYCFDAECPQRKYSDRNGSGDVNLALINGSSLPKCTLIINLNIGTSFVGTGALRAEISIWKTQICIHLQTRALVKSIILD